MGTVGGNTLGLYGSLFGPDGASVLAHSFQGAFHMWHQQQVNKTTCKNTWARLVNTKLYIALADGLNKTKALLASQKVPDSKGYQARLTAIIRLKRYQGSF